MLLVDIHAHLDHEKFKKDLSEVIERARKTGIKRIITSGVNSITNRIVLDISKKYPDIVKVSFGIYPLDALAKEIEAGEASGFPRDIMPINVNEELKWIEENKDKCVAIGECGMDFNWGREHIEEQKRTFQKVIDLAEKIDKPIIVHTRKAELECVEMLESSNLKKIVLHCFMGRKSLIKRVAENGWYFSIPPIIVRLQHFQVMVDMVNINQLLTETDSPYLSPFPRERNEPAFVIETIKKIAEIKNFTPEEVANNIWINYNRLFL